MPSAAAILAQAFVQKLGDPAVLKQGPDDSEFALQVEQVTPAKAQDFATARDKVAAAVQRDAVHRAAEQQAATLFAQARAHGGLAATGGADVVHAGPVHRGVPAAGVPAELAQLAFSLAPGNSTMVEVPDGFVVATVTGIQHPEPSANRLAYDRLQTSLNSAVGDDIEASYSMALREKTRPVLNAQAVRGVIGQ